MERTLSGNGQSVPCQRGDCVVAIVVDRLSFFCPSLTISCRLLLCITFFPYCIFLLPLEMGQCALFMHWLKSTLH